MAWAVFSDLAKHKSCHLTSGYSFKAAHYKTSLDRKECKSTALRWPSTAQYQTQVTEVGWRNNHRWGSQASSIPQNEPELNNHFWLYWSKPSFLTRSLVYFQIGDSCTVPAHCPQHSILTMTRPYRFVNKLIKGASEPSSQMACEAYMWQRGSSRQPCKTEEAYTQVSLGPSLQLYSRSLLPARRREGRYKPLYS